MTKYTQFNIDLLLKLVATGACKSKADLARCIGIRTNTLSKWIKERPELAAAVKQSEEISRNETTRVAAIKAIDIETDEALAATRETNILRNERSGSKI